MPAHRVLKPSIELSFGPYGGAELFFADLDNDGQMEILAYQGPAVFGASLYRRLPHVAATFPASICLSAFRADGRRLWTYGQPNPADRPYICHAHESCVATGDVDGDGLVEVALADGDRVVLLDGASGRVRAERRLPSDNFYIVQALGGAVGAGEAALLVKNGEGGYFTWCYGEPVLGLDAQLNTVWGPVAAAGGGHHILTRDLDGDGRREYLVGYCQIRPDGTATCIVDAVQPAALDALSGHVDYADILELSPGRLLLGFAGSDKAYAAASSGQTLFVKPDRHVQGCALGRFRDDSDWQLAIYNDDGPLVLYNPTGGEVWRQLTEERWPFGMPACCSGRVFHRNRPIVRFTCGRDLIVFTDGGWPYALDGDGRIALDFDVPEKARQPECPLVPNARADDMGFGFATQVVEWTRGHEPAAVVYDRRHLWVYPVA